MDDINPVVIDNGSGVIKAGFAGDDEPRSIFPTVIGRRTLTTAEAQTRGNKNYFVGDEAMAARSTLALKRPIEHGIVSHWQDMEDIWRHTFYDELKVSPENYPLVMSEPVLNPRPNREKMTEIMFEQFKVPSLYVANQAVLAQLESGYSTGIVVSSGDGVTQVVPVFFGHAIEHASAKLDVGGRDLTDFLGRLLTDRGFTPQHSEVLREIKEKRCQVALNYEEELQQINACERPPTTYELPDGDMVTLGEAKFKCAEAMFNPSLLGIEAPGVHEMVKDAITKCHADMQKYTDSKFVLVIAGGNTQFCGFADRLEREVMSLGHSITKPKVIARPDRKLNTWLGGSLFGSMLVNLWQDASITKKEYEEFGAKIVHRKCF